MGSAHRAAGAQSTPEEFAAASQLPVCQLSTRWPPGNNDQSAALFLQEPSRKFLVMTNSRTIRQGCLKHLLLVITLVNSGVGESGSGQEGEGGSFSYFHHNSDNEAAAAAVGDIIDKAFSHKDSIVEGSDKTFDTVLPNTQQIKHIRNTLSDLHKLPGATSNNALDPVFNEILDVGENNNSKRGALDLYNMIKCGTGCNPLVYKGYGCYCGFLGSGGVVDGIDRCCKMHDWCYYQTSCMGLEFNLPYFVPYKWTCNGGAPYCMAGKTKKTNAGSCSHQLCECDREFVECLKEFPCPYKKAMCRSPWRYWQNLFMGLGTGMPMDESHMNSIHGRPHRLKPQPLVKYPKPKFHKNRLNIEFG